MYCSTGGGHSVRPSGRLHSVSVSRHSSLCKVGRGEHRLGGGGVVGATPEGGGSGGSTSEGTVAGVSTEGGDGGGATTEGGGRGQWWRGQR